MNSNKNKIITELSDEIFKANNYKEVDIKFKEFLESNNIDLFDLESVFLRKVANCKRMGYRRISAKLLDVVRSKINEYRNLGFKHREISEKLGLKKESHVSFILCNVYVSKNILESTIDKFPEFNLNNY